MTLEIDYYIYYYIQRRFRWLAILYVIKLKKHSFEIFMRLLITIFTFQNM